MTTVTPGISRKVSSLILMMRKLRRAIHEKILEAQDEGNTDERDRLIRESMRLDERYDRLVRIEIDIVGSQLDPSEAERHLEQAVKEGQRLIRRLNTIAEVLSATARVISVIDDVLILF